MDKYQVIYYIVDFILGISTGYIIGLLESRYKANKLEKNINQNEKNAQDYLKWLQDDINRQFNEMRKSVLEEVRRRI